MIRIAIFVSGRGSNAGQLIKHFQKHQQVRVEALLSNNPQAGALQVAEKEKVSVLVFSRKDLAEGVVTSYLKVHKIDWIVLAGFIWLLPPSFIHDFAGRIINIHPALLPDFGGRGMYGLHVHEAVKNSGATETGITIHLVNEKYDDGEILFQAKCPVDANDTATDISSHVLRLEHRHFAAIVEHTVLEKT